MKKRIPAIITALTFSMALIIAGTGTARAVTNEAKPADSSKASSCCHGPTCGKADSGSCSCGKKGGATCATTDAKPARKVRKSKEKPAAKGSCCASEACGNSTTAKVKSPCSCKKKGPNSCAINAANKETTRPTE